MTTMRLTQTSSLEGRGLKSDDLLKIQIHRSDPPSKQSTPSHRPRSCSKHVESNWSLGQVCRIVWGWHNTFVLASTPTAPSFRFHPFKCQITVFRLDYPSSEPCSSRNACHQRVLCASLCCRHLVRLDIPTSRMPENDTACWFNHSIQYEPISASPIRLHPSNRILQQERQFFSASPQRNCVHHCASSMISFMLISFSVYRMSAAVAVFVVAVCYRGCQLSMLKRLI